MPTRTIPDLAVVLTFLRTGQGWSQTELGEATNLSRNLLNDYERGRKPLKRGRLEYIISFMGLSPEVIDETLEQLEKSRATSRTPRALPGTGSDTRRRVDAVAAKLGRLSTEFAREALAILTLEGERLQARQQADLLWARLKRRAPDEQRAIVEEGRAFRTWALCERVAAESIAVAPSSPAQALNLAGLALRIGEVSLGEDWLRSRTQGYAWFHVANARRVVNDLPGAEAALASARRSWEAGAHGDPGLFNEAVVLGIEANLQRVFGRFPSALRRIEEALVSPEAHELRGKLLLTKAQILEAMGDTRESVEVLRKAVPLVDERADSRTALGIRFHLLVNLCLDDRAPEAVAGLPAVFALAERLGQEMDLVRVVWLSGKIAAGTGDAKEAEAAFEQARAKFAGLKPPLAFNYALVSLDLALLLLEQGRAAEVRSLAEQMRWIFKSQGIHEKALAALRLFQDAVLREAATASLTREIIRFLHRSQDNPSLSFRGGGGEDQQ